MQERDRPLVFLVAGEPSGDRLGARLMAALKSESDSRVDFVGVGGEAMSAEGLKSLFPMSELAVMGLVEVLPHIPRIMRRIGGTVAAVRSVRPDIVVTIDAPGFSFRVARRLRGAGIPMAHVVAPSVWAWKPWRARKIAADLDHLLALLPFEPPYFERHGLPTTFIGHPAVEDAERAPDRKTARRQLGLIADAPVICVLPGSRLGEVRRMGPIFGTALGLLKERFPDLTALVPTVENVADQVHSMASTWPLACRILRSEPDKLAAYAASDVALATSGTVAVELAVAGLPAVIAYRVDPVSAALARRMIKVPFVSLPNLVLKEAVQPEYLQKACSPEGLADAIGDLICDSAARAAQTERVLEAARRLGMGDEAPSLRAARAILSLISAGGRFPSRYTAPNHEEVP